MPIKYDINTLNRKLADPSIKPLADEIEAKIRYCITQRRRTANTELLVKETTLAIINKMYEYDVMNDNKELNNEVPF